MKATATATCKSFCEIFHKVPTLLVSGDKKPIPIRQSEPVPQRNRRTTVALSSWVDQPEGRFSRLNLHLQAGKFTAFRRSTTGSPFNQPEISQGRFWLISSRVV